MTDERFVLLSCIVLHSIVYNTGELVVVSSAVE